MLSKISSAYVAGFLDADGSIYCSVRKNNTYKYDYSISPYIVFYQSKENKFVLEKIQCILNVGNIRTRSDGMCELIINKIDDIKLAIKILKPFSIAKQKQIILFEKIIQAKNAVKNKEDFEATIKLIQNLKDLNYSKKKMTYTSRD